MLDSRTASSRFTGIGRYTSCLARAMVGQLAANERLLLLHEPLQESHWCLPEQTGQVLHLETRSSPFDLRQQWRIPRMLRDFEVDLYHSPYYLMPYRPGVPCLLSFHDLIPRFFPGTLSRRARLFYPPAAWLALRVADHVLVPSSATRLDVLAETNLPPDRLSVIPYAADEGFHPKEPATVERVRRRYELPDRYCLYLGTNKPHKNLVRLIEAWQLVACEVPHAPTLFIAGDWDPKYPEPIQRCRELQMDRWVRFLGPIQESDLPALCTGAMVFVYPSVYEGFGLPVVEAMACGTAVICTETSSLPEVARSAALFFDPIDVRSIAKAIGRVLTDEPLREDLSQRGIARAAHFCWSDTAAATLDVYRRLTVVG